MTAARPLVVVITGSECTGKTTLAKELAAHYAAPCSPEHVRDYLDRKGLPLDASDVEEIARGQVEVEDAAISAGTGVVIKDTDLISTVVYSAHYYGACPGWVERAARDRLGHVYLLLHPDVPWVADGMQRDRPEQRERLHALFRTRLASFGARVVEVRGDWDARREQALAAIALLLEQGSEAGAPGVGVRKSQ
jgi:NadR type nicotinamide-nucleotide adenylyltransferase